jgi:selenocysteine lyase/cysteine desulfurase
VGVLDSALAKISDAVALSWAPESPRGYLNTATVGVPPRAAVEAVEAHIARWRDGQFSVPTADAEVDRCRAAFGRLVGVRADEVAVAGVAAAFVGLVAASLAPDAQVLVADGEFTSVLFPFLEQQRRGVQVRSVALEDLVDAIDARTDIVAVSAAQSADGRLIDLDALAAAARHNGADVLLDATQAAGWMEIDASRFTYVVASAYKWLMCTRGVAFMAAGEEAAQRLMANHANWYGGDDRWNSIYGAPLRLARGAWRLDVSPAWTSTVGGAVSLELLAELGPATIGAHNVSLANRLRRELGMAECASAIVSVAAPGAVDRLTAAGLRFATRAGNARVSFHLYNNDDDVDLVLAALRG